MPVFSFAFWISAKETPNLPIKSITLLLSQWQVVALSIFMFALYLDLTHEKGWRADIRHFERSGMKDMGKLIKATDR